MASLTVISGDDVGKQFLLANRSLSIGRDPARDVQLIDPKVSRRHALLRRVEGTYRIVPTRPLNGLIINGVPIATETVLRSGDEIVFGDTVLRFDDRSDPARTDALQLRKVAGRVMREKHTLM